MSHSSVATFITVVAIALPTVGACERGPDSARATTPPSTPARPGQLRDDDIARTILRYVKEDRVLRGQSIQVEVTQGIANLDGSAATLVARERASALAGTIRGVRSVVNRIVVAAPVRSDDAIRSDVAEALHDDLAIRTRSIDVAVKRGIVLLTGKTDSWQERTLIEDATRAVPGVHAVDNRIELHYAMVRHEAEIAGEVRQRIDDDVWLDGATIA